MTTFDVGTPPAPPADRRAPRCGGEGGGNPPAAPRIPICQRTELARTLGPPNSTVEEGAGPLGVPPRPQSGLRNLDIIWY